MRLYKEITRFFFEIDRNRSSKIFTHLYYKNLKNN